MSLRKILKKGESALEKKSHPITAFDSKLGDLLDDLGETLKEAGGLGLAAPQIGILRRVVVVMDANDRIIELVNPSIIWKDGEQSGFEGCLSVPGYWGIVKRPKTVRLRAQDRTGVWFEVEDVGMTARCFCHELDHLDGRLYTELVDGKLYTNEEMETFVEGQSTEGREP